MTKHRRDLSIVISGEAGQGLKTIESAFLRIIKKQGLNGFVYNEFMSRIRGGNNSTEIRISEGFEGKRSFVNRIDLFVSLQQDATKRFQERITEHTLLSGDEKNIPEIYRNGNQQVLLTTLNAIAMDAGGKIYLSAVVIGFLCGLMGFKQLDASDLLIDTIKTKNEATETKNIAAFTRGYNQGTDLLAKHPLSFIWHSTEPVKQHIILYGSEAIGIGALAGGCNFISSYPMSPSTGVLNYLFEHAEQFHIVVDQAEDEIAAVNMAIGSWYAGGRALVTTSGGGFALMTEGISLAGAMEMPLVIHLAQRPGPATGMPTRTEQGDLHLALYGGHGDFPRIVLAPSSIEDGIGITAKAFNLADQYQVPVIVLTDQYLIDSAYNLEMPDISGFNNEYNIIETDEHYQRYKMTDSGISPRGVPGWGAGMVAADSHEHEESGHLTEDFTIRKEMVDKRQRKLKLADDDFSSPYFSGNSQYKTLLVGWGSTIYAIAEALAASGRQDLGLLHCTQLYPLGNKTIGYLKKATRVIVIENNANAAFGQLIRTLTGISYYDCLLKYNGMPFTEEELTDYIKNI